VRALDAFARALWMHSPSVATRGEALFLQATLFPMVLPY
jgi:hypothetical protein